MTVKRVVATRPTAAGTVSLPANEATNRSHTSRSSFQASKDLSIPNLSVADHRTFQVLKRSLCMNGATVLRVTRNCFSQLKVPVEPLKGLRSIVPVCSSLVRNSKMAKRRGICDAVGCGVYQGTRNNSFKPHKLVFKLWFFLAFYCGVVLSCLGSVSGGNVNNSSSSSQELNATPSNDKGPSRVTPELRQKVIDEVAKQLVVIADEVEKMGAKKPFRGANTNAQEASETNAPADAPSKITSIFGAAASGLGAAADASYGSVKKVLDRESPDMVAARKFVDDQGWWEGMFPLMVAAAAYEATKRVAGHFTSTEGKSAAKSGELKEFAEKALQTETEEDLGSSVD